jgi:hypothetical protein
VLDNDSLQADQRHDVESGDLPDESMSNEVRPRPYRTWRAGIGQQAFPDAAACARDERRAADSTPMPLMVHCDAIDVVNSEIRRLLNATRRRKCR